MDFTAGHQSKQSQPITDTYTPFTAQ